MHQGSERDFSRRAFEHLVLEVVREDVGKLAPHALRVALDLADAVEVEVVDVWRAVERHDVGVGPVAHRGKAPRAHAAVLQRVERRFPVRAVYPLPVRLREIELRDDAASAVEALDVPFVLAFAPAVAEERIVSRRQPREEALAPGHGRLALEPHVVASEREENMSVGIDEPPAALHLLRTEHPRRLQLRACAPAAEAVRPGNRRVRVCGEIRLFRSRGGLELVDGVHLPRPLAVRELPKLVHEREERVVDLENRVRFRTLGADVAHVEERRSSAAPADEHDGRYHAALLYAAGVVLPVVARHAGKAVAAWGHRTRRRTARRGDVATLAGFEAERPGRIPAVRLLGETVHREIERAVGPVGNLGMQSLPAVQRERLREEELYAALLLAGRNVNNGSTFIDAHFRASEALRLRPLRGEQRPRFRRGERERSGKYHWEYPFHLRRDCSKSAAVRQYTEV